MTDLEIIQKIDRADSRFLGFDSGQLQHQRDIVGRIKEGDEIVELENEADLVQP
jgi:hypothetical protein